ncbi:GNAT family N-acetyltransferase [Enterococcus sp. LJL128]|uniref:GNAT family N-acetyltransferase n=1 Tax=Enterococcus sp. LJL51 TaxID=3416656 RepID=UPI003CF1309F
MIRIRRSIREDIAELAKLRVCFFEEENVLDKDKKIMLEQKTIAYLDQHLDNDLIIWQAESRERVIATAFLEIAERLPHPARPNGKIGTLLNVYTDKAFRRQGIAQQLVAALITEGRESGLDKIELLATESGFPVYQRLGFKESQLPDKQMVLEFE